MSFQIGIVGLPNVGKSTLFTALTKKQVDAANYPFCTIDPNVGVVPVPDERLEQLAKLSQSKKVVPTVVEFVDIAGLVAGASKGEGLGNKFLANIREVDAILHVVRGFDDPNVLHVNGSVDAKRDIAIINTELILADLETVSKRLASIEKKAVSTKDKTLLAEVAVLKKIEPALNDNKFASTVFDSIVGTGRDLSLPDIEERKIAKQLGLLTLKPMIYAVNLDEQQITQHASVVQNLLGDVGPALPICAKIEAELSTLPAAEAQEYLTTLGLQESGLDAVIKKAYTTLNLITFLTTGADETRAWTVTKGATAPQAAGVIHTDFEKGFIKAEVYFWQELITAGSEAKLRNLGRIRLEGKDYIMQDGDVCFFKFSV